MKINLGHSEHEGKEITLEEFEEVTDKDDDSIFRDIVIEMAKQLFVASLRYDATANTMGIADPEFCISTATIWAAAQIKFCKEQSNKEVPPLQEMQIE
jgi:hypothetical protein